MRPLLVILITLQFGTEERVRSQVNPAPSSEAEIREAVNLSSEVTALIRQRYYDLALPKALSAVQVSERVYPPEHSEVASAHARLAFIYLQRKDYPKAEQHYLRTLAIQDKILPPDDPNLAQNVNNLGFVYYSQGDLTRAEPLFQRALQIQEKAKGLENLDAANILSNLGLIRFSKGDYSAAGEYFRDSLAIHEKLPDVDNRAILIKFYNCALAYYSASNNNEAKRVLDQALNIIHKIPDGEPQEALPILATLVMIYTQEGNYDKAKGYAERGLALVEGKAVSDATYIAFVYSSLGYWLKVKGDYRRSELLYQRALDAAERIMGMQNGYTAEVLSDFGGLYVDKDEYDKAQIMLERALTVCRNSVGTENQSFAKSLANLAELYRRKGKNAEAESRLKQSQEIYERLLGEQHPQVARIINLLGAIYVARGDYKKGEEYYSRTLTMRRNTLGEEHPDTIESINNIGHLYWARGDYNKAQVRLEQALELLKKVKGAHPPLAIAILSNFGHLHIARGDTERAKDYFQQAMRIAEDTFGPEHQYLAASLGNLANCYMKERDWDKAKALLERARSILEKILGADHASVATVVNNLGLIFQEKREFDKAESAFKAAIAINEKKLGPEHLELATNLNNLALLCHIRTRLSKAETLYHRVVRIYEKSQAQNHPGFSLVLTNLSVLYASRGHIDRAISFASRAAEIEEHNLDLMLSTGSENQRRIYWSTLYGATMTNVSLHAMHAPNNTLAAKLALTTVLRRKGRVLDAMAESMQALRLRPGQPDQSLLEKLSAVQSQLAALVLGTSNGTDSRYDHKLVAELEKEHQRLEAILSASSAEFRVRSEPVTVEGIQRLIPDGAALVEFFSYEPFSSKIPRPAWQPRRYIAYILKNKGKVLSADLGDAATIDADAMELRVRLRNPKVGDVKRLARELDEKIMRPIRRRLGKTRLLLLSPDGWLQHIPFEALVDERNRYLTEGYLFTYLSSGRDLHRLQLKAESRQPPLIIANPDFDKGGSEAGASRAGSTGAGLESAGPLGINYARLEGTEEEAEQIAGILPQAQILTGPEATEAALRQAHGPSILHIATHGFFPEYLPGQEPHLIESTVFKPTIINLLLGYSYGKDATEQLYSLLKSGIVLAGANNGKRPLGDDGLLTALEAVSLDLWGTKLVVLSACETAVSDVDPGYGVSGLRRGLMLAGAESQVMSLWKVDDNVTRDIMITFYTRLRAGDSRSEALRKVRLSMLSSKEFNHPYYWASFIQSGDWRQIENGAAVTSYSRGPSN